MLPRYLLFLNLIIFTLSSQNLLQAQESVNNNDQTVNNETVSYPSEFFDRYRPNTALDMVRQLPGFQLDDGDGSRGFATAAGNILINGRRLSAKQDLPSATLSRIPVSQVERIELIRGESGGIDLQGQSQIANIILQTENPASVRWQTWIQHNYVAAIKGGGNVSMSDRWGSIDFNAGLDLERDTSGWTGPEYEYNRYSQLIYSGMDISTETGFRINSASLNTSTWFGENFVQFNSRMTTNQSHYHRPTNSIYEIPPDRIRDVIIDIDRDHLQYEFGADIERNLTESFTGKAIILYVDEFLATDSTRENIESGIGKTLFRVADTDTDSKERIARLEFDWSRFANHAIQFNAEWARNILVRSLVQTDDRGAGAVTVDVPGANSRVKEIRWDFLLQDNWSFGAITLDIGLSAEASTLSQSGDAELSRDFFFVKPHAIMTYSRSQENQTRLRIAREVSQLDLEDFVSATVFEDDDLALGNPNIRPDTTWIAELIHERRFGSVGVFKLTLFHHWIKDVLDLLPLSPDFEAPGNIGDGRRWGMKIETTIPLDSVGLRDARMDLSGTLQDSTVTDPVTGIKRRLSGQGGQGGYSTLGTRNLNMPYLLSIDFRQDFNASQIAWGWTVAERGNRPLYKVNEFEDHNDGVAFDIFIETTRWFGIKTRFLVENALDFVRRRERTFYEGERSLSPVSGFFDSQRHTGRRFTLYLDGNF